jgi:hypothetical protein
MLLKLLPYEKRNEWDAILSNQWDDYYALFDEFVRDPNTTELAALETTDSPYSTDNTSKFIDMELLVQINRDVRRTYPDLSFFQTKIVTNNISPLFGGPGKNLNKKRRSLGRWLKYQSGDGDFGSRQRLNTNSSAQSTPDYHWEALERILYLYCKLNPGVGYVQGMNNIVAPIYFVCVNDCDEKTRGK